MIRGTVRAVSLTGWWLPSCCSCPALPPTGQVILDAHPRRAARAGRLVPLSVKTAPSGPCSSVSRSGGVTRYRLSLDIIGTSRVSAWNAYASLTVPARRPICRPRAGTLSSSGHLPFQVRGSRWYVLSVVRPPGRTGRGSDDVRTDHRDDHHQSFRDRGAHERVDSGDRRTAKRAPKPADQGPRTPGYLRAGGGVPLLRGGDGEFGPPRDDGVRRETVGPLHVRAHVPQSRPRSR